MPQVIRLALSDSVLTFLRKFSCAAFASCFALRLFSLRLLCALFLPVGCTLSSFLPDDLIDHVPSMWYCFAFEYVCWLANVLALRLSLALLKCSATTPCTVSQYGIQLIESI